MRLPLHPPVYVLLAPSFFPDTDLSRASSEAVRRLSGNKWLSFCSDLLNNFEYLMQNSSSAGQVVEVAEVLEIPEMRSPKLIQN